MYKCHYEHAPECQYLAENCGMVVTHIWHTQMGICVGCHYCTKRLWSGHTLVDHSKTITPRSPEMTATDSLQTLLESNWKKFMLSRSSKGVSVYCFSRSLFHCTVLVVIMTLLFHRKTCQDFHMITVTRDGFTLW